MIIYLVEEGEIIDSAVEGTPEAQTLYDRLEIMQNKGHHAYTAYEKANDTKAE